MGPILLVNQLVRLMYSKSSIYEYFGNHKQYNDEIIKCTCRYENLQRQENIISDAKWEFPEEDIDFEQKPMNTMNTNSRDCLDRDEETQLFDNEILSAAQDIIKEENKKKHTTKKQNESKRKRRS